MKVRFLPAVVFELESAAEDYEEVEPGLGNEFRQEVRSIVAFIERHHRIGPAVNVGTKTALREFVLNRFPYRLIYSIDANAGRQNRYVLLTPLSQANWSMRRGSWAGSLSGIGVRHQLKTRTSRHF